MTWLRWNWLDHGLLPLLLAVMRFCWLWPWLALLRLLLSPSHEGALLAPGLLIGTPLLSLALTQAAPLREEAMNKPTAVPRMNPPLAARLGIALLGLLFIMGALWWQLYRHDFGLLDGRWVSALGLALIHWPDNELPAAWLALLVLIHLWLRGVLDGAQVMAHDEIWRSLIIGVAALVGALLLAAAVGLPLPENLGGLVVLFFATGMMALAFSSLKITVGLDYALGLGQRRAARAPQATRYWLISVTVVVAGLLGMGVALATVIAPEQVARLMAQVNRALGFVWQLLTWALMAVSYVIFMAVYLIVLLLRPLIERLMALLQENELFSQLELGEPPDPTEIPEFTPEAIPDAYRWIALAVFVLAILVIFALTLRKFRSAPGEIIDEERESILSAGLLQDQLSSLWRKWFGRLAGALPRFFALDGEIETRRTIRAAYQQLLTTAGAAGETRRPGQTPVEYEHQLEGKYIDVAAPLLAMTERYNVARYAPDPPSRAEADEAANAWRQVQDRLNPQGKPEATSNRDAAPQPSDRDQ